MKIDADIQVEVAEEFCRRLDKGTLALFPDGPGWSIREMQRLQALRDKGEKLDFKAIWK